MSVVITTCHLSKGRSVKVIRYKGLVLVGRTNVVSSLGLRDRKPVGWRMINYNCDAIGHAIVAGHHTGIAKRNTPRVSIHTVSDMVASTVTFQ